MKIKIIGKEVLVASSMFIFLLIVSSVTAVPATNSPKYQYNTSGIEERARPFMMMLDKIENSWAFKQIQKYCDKHFTPEQKAEAFAKSQRLKNAITQNITSLGGDCNYWTDFVDKIALFDSNVLAVCCLLVGPIIGIPIAILICFVLTLIPVLWVACQYAVIDSLGSTFQLILLELATISQAFYWFGILGGIIAVILFLIIDIVFFICEYPLWIIIDFIQVQADILNQIYYYY